MKTKEKFRDPVIEIVEHNKPENNYKKLAEELAELSEVVLKRMFKQDPHKPPMKKMIEEIGDVYLRLHVIVSQEGIYQEVTDRIEAKSKKLLGYIAEGKYEGGV